MEVDIPYLVIDLSYGNDTGSIAANIIDQLLLELGGNNDQVDLESNYLGTR